MNEDKAMQFIINLKKFNSDLMDLNIKYAEEVETLKERIKELQHNEVRRGDVKMDFKVEIDRRLLEEIIDRLGTMIDYADTGDIPRNDKDYKFFFDDLDNARDLYDRLSKMFGETYTNEIKEDK